jgi:iron complex outermembrane receptor protein
MSHPVRPLCLTSLLLAAPFASADEALGPENDSRALDEVIITALPLRGTVLETAQPVWVLSGDELIRQRALSLGETLARQPGVSESAFGPIASRPILRGQGGLRVQTYQDLGETLDVAALSDDHAVSLDPLLAERIEIIRGPAALMFGNAASAGAVNVVTRRLPSQPLTRNVAGQVEARVDEAAGSKVFGGELGWALGGGWQLQLDAFSADSDNIDIPGFAWSAALREELAEEGEPIDESRGTLPNSDGQTDGGAAGLTWFGDGVRIGFSLSRHDMNYGLPGPGEEEGEPSDIRLDLGQDRIDIDAEWRLTSGPFDILRLRGSRNDYQHFELEGDEIGTRYAQMGDEWRLALEHGADGNAPWRGALGLQWRRIDFDAEGEEAFLPPSLSRHLGGFIVQEWDIGRLTLEAGGRLEQQRITPASLEEDLPVYDDEAFSGSLAAVWRWREGVTSTLQITASERHPTATELYANGPHLAVRRIEFGDPELGKEKGLTFDLGLRLVTAGWQTNLAVFVSDYDDYIVAQPIADLDEDDARVNPRAQRAQIQRARPAGGGDKDDLAVIRFEARDTRFRGAEFSVSYPQIAQWANGQIGVNFFGDQVRARDTQGDPLPQIPPHRLGTELSWQGEALRLGITALWHDKQTRVADNELPTEGFTLLGLDASYRHKLGNTDMLWFLTASNLLDEEARRHASPLKDYAPLRGRSISAGLQLRF